MAWQFSKTLNFLFLQFRIIPMITQVGWLRGGAIREQIFIFIRYTFGVGMYDIQLSAILWTCNWLEEALCEGPKSLSLFQVTIMRSNWWRLLVIFIILGAVLILPAQNNQILQLASHRCDLLWTPLLDDLDLRFYINIVLSHVDLFVIVWLMILRDMFSLS